MQRDRRSGRRLLGTALRFVLALIVGGWLGWQIVGDSVAALAARTHDNRLLAVFGTPRHPAAGALLAERLLVAKQTPAAAQLARSIVLADPTNDRALRVLGLSAEQLDRRAEGAAIMRRAAALGWRDTPTQIWAIHDAAVRGDAVALMRRADALARRNRASDLTTPLFLVAITEPATRAALIDSLGQNPVWRGAFFASVQQRLPAASTGAMEVLYRELQSRGVETSAVERLSYVDRLIDLGQFEAARRFWVNAFGLPIARFKTAPFDGDFALLSRRLADTPASQFEWRLNPDMEGVVGFTQEPPGTGLSIPAELSGGTTILSQLLTLPPGDHDLLTDVRGQATAAPVGWYLTCLPSGQELRRSLPNGADDELTRLAFQVPAQGCGAQRLALTTRDQLEAQAVSIAGVRVR